MKKLVCLFALLAAAGILCAQEEAVDINTAIFQIEADMEKQLPPGAKVGVETFASDAAELSRYIARQFETLLNQNGQFSIVERGEDDVARVNAEIDYQYAGNVRDEDLVDIGEEMGVQYLVSGSFVQYGSSYMSLTARLTNITTRQALVVAQRTITSSAVLNSLLADRREPDTAWDYLELIARCRVKRIGIERDRERAVIESTAPIEAKYQAELAKVDRVKPAYESQASFNARVQAAESEINGRRDQEVGIERQRVEALFAAEIAGLQASEAEWTKRLVDETFVLSGDAVETRTYDYDAESDTPGWPFAIESMDRRVYYGTKGTYRPVGEMTAALYRQKEDERLFDEWVGEISYRLVPVEGTDKFQVVVVAVRLYNEDTDATLWSATGEVEVGAPITPSLPRARARRSGDRQRTAASGAGPEYDDEYDGDGDSGAPSASGAGARRPKAPAVPWPKDTIAFGVSYVGNEYFDGFGVYAGFFCTPLGKWIYIDWLNVVCTTSFICASVDAGVHIPLGRFYPFVRFGAGAYESEESSAKQYYGAKDENNGERLDEDGFMFKLGIGTDFRLSEKWKLTAGYELYFLTGSDAGTADGLRIGASFGKPGKK